METGNNNGNDVFQHFKTLETGKPLYTPFPVSNVQGSVLNVSVSYFQYFGATNPVTVSLLTCLCSERHKDKVFEVRSIENKEARDKVKKRLPGFTPSGVFSKRSEAGLIQHSGIICLDIDEQDNPHILNFGALKREIQQIQNVAYFGKSVSGRGWFALVPIEMPEKHRQTYEVLEMLFWHHWRIKLDSNCKDVCRFRYVSYDPEAYFNHSAPPFSFSIDPRRIKAKSRFTPERKSLKTGTTHQKVDALIQEIEKRGIDIAPNYQDWFEIGCALASAFGEGGRQRFHTVSYFYPKYSFREADKQFDHCLKNHYGYTIATFIMFAQRFVKL